MGPGQSFQPHSHLVFSAPSSAARNQSQRGPYMAFANSGKLFKNTFSSFLIVSLESNNSWKENCGFIDTWEVQLKINPVAQESCMESPWLPHWELSALSSLPTLRALELTLPIPRSRQWTTRHREGSKWCTLEPQFLHLVLPTFHKNSKHASCRRIINICFSLMCTPGNSLQISKQSLGLQ